MKKHNSIFSFETLGHMHKNIISFFKKNFCILFLEDLTKTGYFNTGFVFLRCKILLDINQNNIKTTRKNYKTLKQIFLIFFLEMERIRPKYMGWAEPGPTTRARLRVNSALHCSHAREQWRCCRNEAGERKRGEGLTCGDCDRWLCY